MNQKSCKKAMLSNFADISLSRCTCGYYQLNVGSVTLHLEDARIKGLSDVLVSGLEAMEKAETESETKSIPATFFRGNDSEVLQ